MRSRQGLLAALTVLASAISAAGCGGSSTPSAAWTWTFSWDRRSFSQRLAFWVA